MRIGFAFCGSFCTIHEAFLELVKLKQPGVEIVPILSERVFETDTRFGMAFGLRRQIEEQCGAKIIHTIPDAEPLGPKDPLDILVICPCTGNTLAKLANGITDTAVTMAAKAHLRTDRPLVIALASNDAMSANLKNIATLLSRKSVYFVPMKQDDPVKKPHSLVADFSMLPLSIEKALHGEQIYPVFL